MPALRGFTTIRATPLPLVRALLLMPAPLTTTFLPLAGFPPAVTRTTIVDRRPTVRDFGVAVNWSQTACAGLRTTGAGTRVVAVAWLFAVFDSGSLPTTGRRVCQNAGLVRLDDERDRHRLTLGDRAEVAVDDRAAGAAPLCGRHGDEARAGRERVRERHLGGGVRAVVADDHRVGQLPVELDRIRQVGLRHEEVDQRRDRHGGVVLGGQLVAVVVVSGDGNDVRVRRAAGPR